MKLFCLLLAALPLGMAGYCSCGPSPCDGIVTQPAACECFNRYALGCIPFCIPEFNPETDLEDCSVYGPPVRCGSKGLAACPSDLPLCVNTPDQTAIGCTIAADCPGFCVASSDEVCGGITGRTCEDPNATCVDDPRDDCNPALGGADCSGLCVYVKG